MAWEYPLRWPANRPRTPFPTPAKFSRRDDKGWQQKLTFNVGRARLIDQLTLLGADDVKITTNIRWTLKGTMDKNHGMPADRGVAVYFERNGRKIELACDRWDQIADNMAAIAAHIDALRGQERWGVGDIDTAFAGHIALPNFSARKHWTDALGLPVDCSEADIQAAWRARIRDAKTEADQMDINIARDEALAERKGR